MLGVWQKVVQFWTNHRGDDEVGQRPRLILVIGAPGAGKGSACQGVVGDLDGFVHISVGDMFRQAIKDKTPLGIEAERFISRDQFVPIDIVRKRLQERFQQHDMLGAKGILLDGFPRTADQGTFSFSLILSIPPAYPSNILQNIYKHNH